MFSLTTFVLSVLLAVPVGDPPCTTLPAFRAAIAVAKPGRRVTLASGVYEGSIYLSNIRGEKDRPITIAGADAKNPPVIRLSPSARREPTTDGFHLSASAYIVVENLIVERMSGNGVNIDDGTSPESPKPLAESITLRGITVRDVGPAGNIDGIKLSGLRGFTIENCTIERWGSGGSGIDMVGCRDGLIRNSTLRHTPPKTSDATTPGANGIQTKGGSRDITIRGCRFEHAGQRAVNIGGSTGLQFFRPPLTKAEDRGADSCAEAWNITVERCTIIGSEAAVAFVGVDGATVRFNTIYHPRRWAMRILQENRETGFAACRKGQFTDNLVVFGDLATHPRQAAANIGDRTEPASFVFARNVWYFERSPGEKPVLPAAETAAIHGENPRLRDAAKGDLTPAPDGPAAKAGAGALSK